VERQDPVTRVLQAGTVMDIPMDTSKSDDDRLVQFDDATTVSIPVTDMPSLVPTPPVSLRSKTRVTLSLAAIPTTQEEDHSRT